MIYILVALLAVFFAAFLGAFCAMCLAYLVLT